MYLPSIDQSVIFEPNASSKEALMRSYKKEWKKLPLIRKHLALRELNEKIEKALLGSIEYENEENRPRTDSE